MMKCPTCGGECALEQDGAVQTWRCTCCDNVYKVKRGESLQPEAPVRSDRGVKAAQPPVRGANEAQAPARGEKKELSGDEIFSRCIDSVAEVRARRGNTVFSGSAYAFRSGYAITNAHVVAEGGNPADRVEMFACGRSFTADIVALGSRYPEKEDLALLRLHGAPAAFRSVRFADVASLKNGQAVYVIGNSLGGGTCITAGIISDKRRTVEGKPRLMTDCAVNRGNSGGPVFDAYGCVVGTIVSVTTTAEGMNYAIPADVVKKFISRTEI